MPGENISYYFNALFIPGWALVSEMLRLIRREDLFCLFDPIHAHLCITPATHASSLLRDQATKWPIVLKIVRAFDVQLY